jgi:hypothetical protein
MMHFERVSIAFVSYPLSNMVLLLRLHWGVKFNGFPTWGLLFKIHKNQVFKNLCLRMRVAAGAIISRSEGRRFIFNPYRGWGLIEDEKHEKPFL